MPTAYTSELMENGQTFEDFVMRCARAMGACASMRDEPLSTPIPEKFTPSDYYRESLDAANLELETLENTEDRQAYVQKVVADEIARKRKRLSERTEEDGRLSRMEEQVRNSTALDSHVEMRDFMLQQINVSKHGEDLHHFSEIELLEKRAENYKQYFKELLEDAKKDASKAAERLLEEVTRCETRTEWFLNLRASLKMETTNE